MVKTNFQVTRVFRTFGFNNSQGEHFTVKIIWDNPDKAVCDIGFQDHPVYGSKIPWMRYTGYKPTVRQDIMKLIREHLRKTGIGVSSFNVIDEGLTLFAYYGSNQRAGWANEVVAQVGVPGGNRWYNKAVTYFGAPGRNQVFVYLNNGNPHPLNKCITDYRGLVSTFKQLVESGQI